MGRRYEVWRCEFEKLVESLAAQVVRAVGGRGRGGEKVGVLSAGGGSVAELANISGLRDVNAR